MNSLRREIWRHGFKMTENAILDFKIVKNQVAHHTCRVLMNSSDPLILYTEVSTKAIGGVLMQVQGVWEKPCVFVSHTLSNQAIRWEVMELELFVFVFCVKKLSPYLLGKQFTVRTDTRILCTSQIRQFPNWSDGGSSFRSSVFKLSTSLGPKTWWPMDSRGFSS